VYSKNIIKSISEGNNRVTVPSRLHLPSIPNTIQRRVAEVNSTCEDEDEDSSATVIKIIRTPWPIVTGQAILSYVIALRSGMAWSATDPETGLPTNPSWVKGVLWDIGLIRAVGALVYQVMDIAESKVTIPSVGTAITLGTLLSGSFQFHAGITARILSYLGISIGSLGLLLYTINGTLGWVLRGDANDSVILVSGDQVVYYFTLGDWLARISWIAGAVFFLLIVICPIFLPIRCYRLSLMDDGNVRAKYFRRIRVATNYAIVMGGIAAIVSAGMNAAPEEIDNEDMICAMYTETRGSASGFLGCMDTG